MSSLSLIHVGFLAAGLAVAVPIVIHLLFRQRSRSVPIGSLRFLRQVIKEHRRRRRVRQWVLLALRMLGIALLALLFARPYFNDAARKGRQQEIVLVIDRSASMQAASGPGPTAFAQAVAKVKEELKRIDENAIVHVALFDSTAVKEIGLEELARAQPSEAATDYGLALGWAGDLLAASDRPQRQIVLYTDLQRSGLSASALTPLPAGIELLVKDLGQAIVQNVAVETAEAINTELRPERKVIVRAAVRNHGPARLRQTLLLGQLDGPGGTRKSQATVDLPAHGRAMVDLAFDITDDGVYSGEIHVDAADALPLDNRRYVAFEARHPERVLLVDGEEGRSVYFNETYFLETALRLTTEQTENRLRSFEPDRLVWEAGEGFPRLDGFRAIVLANVRRLSDADGDRLHVFVENGGKLLIFVGDQTSRATFAPLARRGLLPGDVAAAPVPGPLRVDAWSESHPALACFRDPQHGDLRRISLEQALPLVSLAEGVSPLLSAGEQTLAAERRIGRGACVYIGFTADRGWTNLPRTRLYVPLMRQLMAWLTDQLGDRRPVIHRTVAASIEHAGLTQEGAQRIVTNIDPKESALERIAADEIEQACGAQPSRGEDREAEAAWAKILPAARLRPEEIWTSVVWLLFVVLAAELLLSARVHA